ncbi:hypothetical protein IW261DRAFT_508905 [Armillaria novae-zelandiae]|uniref:Uncharacterized protein n=1 Tax=Armillaria novae-zelandiae TaxID=153914 RepID=A0AA39P0C2_9AGAR|nr:hypothetical protein IW261DRAFT_508905 [Armillaria novae-zelandiae]
MTLLMPAIGLVTWTGVTQGVAIIAITSTGPLKAASLLSLLHFVVNLPSYVPGSLKISDLLSAKMGERTILLNFTQTCFKMSLTKGLQCFLRGCYSFKLQEPCSWSERFSTTKRMARRTE